MVLAAHVTDIGIEALVPVYVGIPSHLVRVYAGIPSHLNVGTHIDMHYIGTH